MSSSPLALVRPRSIENRQVNLVRQLSCDLAATVISPMQRRSSPALGHNASPDRRPLFPLPSPILALDSPNNSIGEASDDELSSSYRAAAVSAAKRSLKRFRSFGSSSRLTSQLGPSRNAAAGTPSPMHFATRARADSTPTSFSGPVDISDEPAGRPVSLSLGCGSSEGSGATRPPPIHTMKSLEGWGETFAASVESISTNAAGMPPLTIARPPSGIDEHMLNATTDAAPPPTPGRRGFGASMGFGASSMRGGVGAGVPSMSRVAPNLYVGDETAGSSLAMLMTHGVTHVLNCTHMASPLEGVAGAPSVMQLGLLDTTSDLPHMQSALIRGTEFISSALEGGGTVLVHCHRGISRSATLAMAHLVRATQTPAEAVFEQMRAARRIVDPNLGYWVALKEWERRVLPPSLLRNGRSSSLNAPPPTPRESGRPSPLPR